MMIEYFLWQFIRRPFMGYSLLNDARWLGDCTTLLHLVKTMNDTSHCQCGSNRFSVFSVHMKNDDWTNFTRIRHSIYLPIIYLPLLCTDFVKRKKKRILTHTLLRKTVQFSHSQIAVSSAKPWQTMRMTRVILRERFVSNIPFPLRNISIQSFRRCRRR